MKVTCAWCKKELEVEEKDVEERLENELYHENCYAAMIWIAFQVLFDKEDNNARTSTLPKKVT